MLDNKHLTIHPHHFNVFSVTLQIINLISKETIVAIKNFPEAIHFIIAYRISLDAFSLFEFEK